ncbi:MAG: DUF1282 domain-containing protein [Acholeplasmataceae bacterium]|nr:MAG: DUF1282 domain-containing protein [Acholeplasmataceae bacterium]
MTKSIARFSWRNHLRKMKEILLVVIALFIRFPLYILTHPIDGFYEMKHNRQGRLRVAAVFFVIHAVLGIVEFTYTGFLFNTTDPSQFRFLRSILVSVAPYLIFIVANWSITSLMDGKGRFKEIFMVTGYAFFPIIVLRIISIFTSNFFTLEEGFFYHGAITLGYLLMFYLLFMGMRSIHEYSVLRAVTTVILTMVSMSVIVFLGLLALNLAQQIVLFLQTIIREIMLRL